MFINNTMEELLSEVQNSFSISSQDELISRRKDQYKSSGHSIESVRDRRRFSLLNDYKRKREALLNEKRGLLNVEFDDNDEDEWMDWQQNSKARKFKRFNKYCKDQLMLSEWLLDRPVDLEREWTLVLCPEGRRTLVIAQGGCTRAYHKNGRLLAKFRSVLPQGSPATSIRSRDKTILDCVWKEDTRQLFALDVLQWRKQTLLNCDANFRLYWLKSKLTEVKQELKEMADGVYDVLLPHHCTLSTVVQGLSEHHPSQVDGVLFYHNSAPYISGLTPLVGWLKPFMLQERFNLAVPQQYLDLRPPTYMDLEQWVDGVLFYHNSAPYISGHTPLVGWLKPFMLQERFNLAVPQQYMDLRPPTYVDLEQWVSQVSHCHRRTTRKQEGMDMSDSMDSSISEDNTP